MKTDLKTTLRRAMDQWVKGTCDHPDRPEEGYIHPELYEQMADAAEAVYDSAFAAQFYAKNA